MFTWGLVCVLMAFMTTQTEFYIYRFLLGASEASLYPVIYSVLFPGPVGLHQKNVPVLLL